MAGHIRGNAEASILLLEYGDYQCPFCQAAQPLVRRIRRHFGNRMAFEFRHFPLTEEHPKAFAMAEAAEAAATQRKFWQMHDVLFTVRSVTAAVRSVGLDMKKFRAELATGRPQQTVDADITSGIHIGVNGTPSFFVNGKRYDGEHEFHAMVEYIERIADKSQKRKKK